MKKNIFYVFIFMSLFAFCNQSKQKKTLSERYTIQEQPDTNVQDSDDDKSKFQEKPAIKPEQQKEEVPEAARNQNNNNYQKNAIFVDPEFTGTEKGTMDQPFKNITEIKWNEGLTVLIKKGSIILLDAPLRPTANNIIIGAYGNGQRPLIKSSVGNGGKIIDLGSLANITVRDIEVQSTNYATTCFHFINSQNGRIINCKVRGSEWGIRNINSEGIFEIMDCEVSETGDDGIFIRNAENVKITGTRIHEVNLKYRVNPSEKYSGGDCLQLFDVKNFIVSGNKFDHGSTGNKFCLISNGDGNFKSQGIIEKNTFSRNGEGILVYLDVAKDIIIRQNRFINAEIAIYSHSTNPIISFNEFVKIKDRVFMIDSRGTSTETLIFNNTFADFNNLMNNTRDKIKFENNIFYNGTGSLFTGVLIDVTDINCFYGVKNFKEFRNENSIIADPLFTNFENLDFTLKENSPCIDKGKRLSGEYLDIYGNKVPVGETFDLGAHEFIQITSSSSDTNSDNR